MMFFLITSSVHVFSIGKKRNNIKSKKTVQKYDLKILEQQKDNNLVSFIEYMLLYDQWVHTLNFCFGVLQCKNRILVFVMVGYSLYNVC